MPLDESIPFKALAGLQKAQPYDPIGVQNDIDRGRVYQAQAQKARQQMAEQADLQQLAQQYGNDYDGLIDAAAKRGHTEWALDITKKLQEGRAAGAQQRWEQTRASRAEIQSDLAEVQGADATTWPDTSQRLAKKYPALAPALLRPFSPQLQQQLISIGQSQDQWLQSIETGAKSVADGKTLKGFAEAYAGADTPEKRAVVDQMADSAKAGGIKTYFPDVASAQGWLEKNAKADPEKAAKVGTFEDYVVRTYGANPTPAQILAARKAYGQADDRAVKVSVNGGGSGAPGPGDLTPEGIEYAATQYRLTGKMPPLGMGKTPARGQIINKAAEQARTIGQTPVASIQRQAAFSADGKSLAKIKQMSDAAAAYENKAMAQLDIVDGLSDKVGRTSIPLINRAIMAGKTEIAGDPDATLLLNAIQTASAEYAKIMMGGTASASALTDSAQKEAQKLLNASMSPATLRKATALMRKEMDLTNQGYGATIDHINERMGGQSQAAPTSNGPQVGEKRKFGNKVGQWDGKNWVAVP